MVKIEVTQKCNSRCLSCTTWKMSKELLTGGGEVKEELSFEEHLKLVDQIKELGCKYIEIHGGEPTLYKKLPELVEYCTSLGIETFFSTNGLSMTKELAEKLVNLGLKRINFSLDGPKECHNILRGREDAFDKLIQAIEHMNAADPLGKVFKTINTNITVINIDRIEEVVQIAAEHGIQMINFTHPTIISEEVADVTNSYFGEPAASHRVVAEKELVLRDIEKIKEKREVLKKHARKYGVKIPRTMFFTRSLEDISNGVKRDKEQCLSIYESCTIDAFGNVFPCEIIRYNLGNVREQSMKEVYQGQRFEEFTKKYSENICNLDICTYCVDTVHDNKGSFFI